MEPNTKAIRSWATFLWWLMQHQIFFPDRWTSTGLGIMFASLQKNLGPAGTALVLIRKDLIGHAMELTPSLLDYSVYDKSHSLANTNNTFAIYTTCLVMEWLKKEGGLEAMARIESNEGRYPVSGNR